MEENQIRSRITGMTSNDCVDFLRQRKSEMPEKAWKEYIERIIAGAEGKDDW